MAALTTLPKIRVMSIGMGLVEAKVLPRTSSKLTWTYPLVSNGPIIVIGRLAPVNVVALTASISIGILTLDKLVVFVYTILIGKFPVVETIFV